MSLIKCRRCGEMFSDSYKTCPFCEEDDAYYGGRAFRPAIVFQRFQRMQSDGIVRKSRQPFVGQTQNGVRLVSQQQRVQTPRQRNVRR